MSRDIRVFGELELLELVRRGEPLPDHLVSIGNPRLPWRPAMPGERLPPEFRGRFRRILRLTFFDVERKDLLGAMRPRRIPEARDVRRLLRFWERSKHEATGYVLHCWGGVSRSTAMALGLLYLDSGSEAAAASRLRELRPEAGPHRGILRHLDAELGSRLLEAGEAIVAARMEAWRRELDMELAVLCEELPAVEE
ncbi:MAG: hypothetical protein JNG85_11875 [Spirochaetaceae bacterium]|nr:hypothetical protein [Spirochaetaceae bacterium]